MAEPSTTALVTATAGIGLASLMPGIDGNALVGAFAGATLFVMSAKELGILMRLIYMLISLIMGYLAAPEVVANTFIQESAVAGFIAGLLCVSIALMLIERMKEKFDILDIVKRMRL